MLIDLKSLMLAMMLGKNGSSGSGSIEGLPELENPASSGDVAYSKQYINGSGVVKTGTLAEREHSDISISIPEGDSEDAVAKVSVKRGIYRNTSNEIFYVNIPTEDVEITPGSEDIVLYNSEGALIRMVKVLGDDLSDVLGDISGETNRAKIEALLGIANGVIADDADDLYDAIEELVYGYYRGTTPNLIESKTIEANGTYHASDENADGYKSVEVNVLEPNLSDVLGDNSGKSNREKIVNAIGSANAVTGESDETLTGAIGSLSEGYVSADTIGEATGTTSQDKVEYLIGVANETIDGTNVSTLADAVDALADGYGQGGGGLNDLNLYVKSLYMAFSGATGLPDTLVINAPNCTTLRQTFTGIKYTDDMAVRPAREITVNAGELTNLREYVIGGNTTGSSNTATQIFHLNCTFKNCNFMQAFNLATALQEIDCELDFTGSSSVGSMFAHCSDLREVRFKSGTLALDMSLSHSGHLTDESLVSIANGLDPAAAKTLTLHADSLARCGEIMGTVVDDTFTADENGTVALDDFVTTIGWTLTA